MCVQMNADDVQQIEFYYSRSRRFRERFESIQFIIKERWA